LTSDIDPVGVNGINNTRNDMVIAKEILAATFTRFVTQWLAMVLSLISVAYKTYVWNYPRKLHG